MAETVDIPIIQYVNRLNQPRQPLTVFNHNTKNPKKPNERKNIDVNRTPPYFSLPIPEEILLSLVAFP